MREQAQAVRVTDDVITYIAQISQWLRASDDVVFGPSPRGSIGLLLAARVMAAAHGGEFITPDDVQAWHPPCCATGSCSRPTPSSAAATPDDVIAAALAAVHVPR